MSFVRINKKITRPAPAPAPTASAASATDASATPASPPPAAAAAETGVLGTAALTARPATRSSVAASIKAHRAGTIVQAAGSSALPGVRPWVSSQLLTGTGTPAWDALLSGGFPLGTVVATTPDGGGSALHAALARAFLREGARLGQAVVAFSASAVSARKTLCEVAAVPEAAVAVMEGCSSGAVRWPTHATPTPTPISAAAVAAAAATPATPAAAAPRRSRPPPSAAASVGAIAEELEEEEEGNANDEDDDDDLARGLVYASTLPGASTGVSRDQDADPETGATAPLTVPGAAAASLTSSKRGGLTSAWRYGLYTRPLDARGNLAAVSGGAVAGAGAAAFGPGQAPAAGTGAATATTASNDATAAAPAAAPRPVLIAAAFASDEAAAAAAAPPAPTSVIIPAPASGSLLPTPAPVPVPASVNSLRLFFSALTARAASALAASGALPATSPWLRSPPANAAASGAASTPAPAPAVPGVARLLLPLSDASAWPSVEWVPSVLRTQLTLPASAVVAAANPSAAGDAAGAGAGACGEVTVVTVSYGARALTRMQVAAEYTRFTVQLRALSQAAKAVVWLTGPAAGGPGGAPALTAATHRCGHSALAVQSFCDGMHPELNVSSFGDFDGMLVVTRLARPNALAPTFPAPDTLHFLLKLRSKGRVEVQKLSLPPEGSRTAASTNPLLNQTLAAQMSRREALVAGGAGAAGAGAGKSAVGCSAGAPGVKAEDMF